MAGVLRIRQPNLPKQPAERARLRVIQGPDMGVTFVITQSKVVVGRGEECHVMLSDVKASRQHAEILWKGNAWEVRDLKSQNGIGVNGSRVESAILRPNDIISLGETSFQFQTVELGTRVLMAGAQNPVNAAVQLRALEEQRERVRALGSVKATGQTIDPGASKRFGLMGLLLVGLGVFLLLPDQKIKRQVAARGERTLVRDLSTYLPSDVTPTMRSQSEAFFRAGFREFQVGNYLRASRQFETALQVNPRHEMAKFYLERSKTDLKRLVKDHLGRGSRSFKSGKLRQARGEYDAVIRILFLDPENEAYQEAREQISKIEERLKNHGS